MTNHALPFELPRFKVGRVNGRPTLLERDATEYVYWPVASFTTKAEAYAMLETMQAYARRVQREG